MNQLRLAALALALCLCAATAQASDLFPPSPVPSSRDTPRPAAKIKRPPQSWQNLTTSNKIVKTTKPAVSPAQKTPTGAAPAQ